MSLWKYFGQVAFLTLLVGGWGAQEVQARNFRPAMLPNAPAGCNTCHTSGGGTPRNAFGLAVEQRVTRGGREQFWDAALAALDSDSDGVSNGQELGDPDGDGTPDRSIEVTHPGDASSFAQQAPPQPPDDGNGQPPPDDDGDAEPAPAPAGAVTLIRAEEGLICIAGPVFLVPGLDVEVVLPDGSVGMVGQAVQSGQVVTGTRMAVEVEAAEEGPPVAVRIRLLGPDDAAAPGPGLLVGALDAIDLQSGRVRLEDRCFRMTEETEFTEEGEAFSLEDLSVGDVVAVTRGERLPDDVFPTAIQVEFLESAPEPVEEVSLTVVSFTIGGQELQEDVKNPVLDAGLHDAEVVFSAPLEVEPDEDGNPMFQNLAVVIFPTLINIGEGITDLAASEDGLTLTTTFDLPENATFQMGFAPEEDAPFEDFQVFYFGTTELSDASVSGTAELPEEFADMEVGGEKVALLMDAAAIQELFAEATGATKQAKLEALARAAKAAVALQVGPGPGPGDGPPGDEGDESNGDDEAAFLEAVVRTTGLDEDLGFELLYVPDGTYILAVSADFEVDGESVSLVGFYGADEDLRFDEVVVEGGESVTDLAVAVVVDEEEAVEVFLEEVRIERVDAEGGRFAIAGPDGPVGVDASGAVIRDPEGSLIDPDDLNEGDLVELFGFALSQDLIRAEEVNVIQSAGPPRVRGQVLSIEPPAGRRSGRLSLIGQVFSFDEFQTQVEDAKGRRINVRDLRPQTPVVIFAQEAEEMGRPPLAVQIGVLTPGEPPPSPDPERGQFVGQVGRIDFEGKRLQLALTVVFNDRTRFVDREGNPITSAEILPESQVRVTVRPTAFGVPGARKVKLLRAPNELAPERIAAGVFLIGGEEVPVQNAAGVPLMAELRVRFDRPLTDRTRDAFEMFVYEQSENGEDVTLQTRVEGGELVATMELQMDTIYDIFGALENGHEVFGTFTTGESLPSLEVVSVSPEDGAAGVATDLPTTISVTFNREIAGEGEEVAAFIGVFPGPVGGEIQPDDLSLSEDRMTISMDVELEPDRTYVVVVEEAFDVNGFELAAPFKSRFSTGLTIGTASVSGSFVLPPGADLDPALRNGIGFVALVPVDEYLADPEADPERLGVGFDVTRSGDFEVTSVPAGRFFIEGFVFLEATGQGLVGYYVDSEGEPLELEVGEGAQIDGITISMSSELRLTDSQPLPGQGGVSSGRTEVSLRFSEPLQQNRGVLALDMEIDPPIQNFNPRRDLRANRADPRRIEAQVKLDPDTDYRLVVLWAQGVSGAELFEVVEIPFSTRDQFVAGSISGSITLDDESAPKGKAILGDLTKEKRIAEVDIRRDGTYRFKNIPEGTYGVFLNLKLADGRELRALLDADGDGKPDPVALEAGETLENIDLQVTVPPAPVEPAPGEGGENANTVLSFDFNTGSGDGKLTVGEISAGDEFQVAVYVDGVSNLIGYDVKVGYDTEKLVLQAVLEEAGEEGLNILKKNGGLGAFIGRVEVGTANLTAAILGPSELVAPEGDGLLGVMQFVALETFTGETALTVSSTVMQGLTVADSPTSDAMGTVRVVELTHTIGLTADPDLISADGSSAATLQAQILDLDGVLQSDDNSTVVTFSVASGSGQLAGEEVTVQSGVAQTTLTSSAAGTVTVQAGVPAARSVTVSVVAQAIGTEVPTGPAGPMALDLNLDAGDQGVRQGALPKAGDTVTIDLVVTEGALGGVGFQALLRFDSSQLAYKDFNLLDVYSGAVPIISVPAEGSVQISAAFLGATAAKDAGSLGQARFEAQAGIGEGASVILVSGEFGTSSGTQKLDIGAGGATVNFTGGATAGPPTPDFDGDGSVGFADFLLFAQAFGKTSAAVDFDAKFDLDSSGDVGFSDFLVFAQAFGT